MGAVTRRFRLTKASTSAGTRRIVLLFSTLVAGMLALAAPASATTETFNVTGGPQTWTVPAGVTQATFDLYGAQGWGTGGLFSPGLGGRATATIAVTPGASIQVNVGGQGFMPGAGFNGGGAGAPPPGGGNVVGGGGGGASDIRIGGTALTDRVLVAGGGGGAAGVACFDGPNPAGGGGGGESGQPGVGPGDCSSGSGGGGGTQSEGGTATPSATAGGLGVGGVGGVDESQEACCGGGGGGGWYGGGGGVEGGGGGGSGYGPPGTAFATGVHGGDGLVTVTYTATIDTLIQSVENLNLPPNLKNNLLQRLNVAKQTPARACNQLAAFMSRVQAQSGNKISGRDADFLTEQALDVRRSAGCDAAPDSCAGQKATIVGTGRADTLQGTKGDDVIATGGGNDRVLGLRGDDIVCGGAGADLLRGQGGDDTLTGGRGKDELRGGGGSNRCRGGKRLRQQASLLSDRRAESGPPYRRGARRRFLNRCAFRAKRNKWGRRTRGLTSRAPTRAPSRHLHAAALYKPNGCGSAPLAQKGCPKGCPRDAQRPPDGGPHTAYPRGTPA